jgi:hypothetical protein
MEKAEQRRADEPAEIYGKTFLYDVSSSFSSLNIFALIKKAVSGIQEIYIDEDVKFANIWKLRSN